MRNMTAQVRATMAQRRNFVNYAKVVLRDGTELNLKPSDFRISGNTFTDDFVDGDNFAIGTTLGKTCTIVLDNTDNRQEEIDGEIVTYRYGKFSEYDFYMSYFYLYVHLPDAWTDDEGTHDWVGEIGKFTVVTPGSRGATIEITGVDDMYKFDKSFDSFVWSDNLTLYSALVQCCEDCSVAIGFDNAFDNADFTIKCDKPEGITYRQMVSYILQIAGYNARISNTGALQLVWYDTSTFGDDADGGTFSYPHLGPNDTWGDGDTLDGGSFNPWNLGDVYDAGSFTDARPYHILNNIVGLTVSTDDIHFTGVKVVNQDDKIEVIYGTDEYIISIHDNALTGSKTEDELMLIATHIYDKVNSIIIRPFSCDTVQNPTIEPGDCVIFWDIKGNEYRSMITNVTYKTSGYTSISCNAKSPTVQGSTFVNSAAQAVVEARRNTEKQIDTYNSTVQHFNELASNSLGYYTTTTQEQGATVTYIHDQPTLEASTIIWKQTATGWFISQDGGQSYTAGVDASTATMLMNLIYVHGVNADWIKTGTLTVGGTGSNKDGSIKVYDKDDNNVGSWDKSGLTATAGKIGGINIYSDRLDSFASQQLTAVRLAPGCLSASRAIGSSWGGLFYGHPSYAYPNSLILYNAGGGDNGITVANASPNQGLDGRSFVAHKYNTLQFWRDWNMQAWVDEGGHQRSSDRRKKKDINPISFDKTRSFFKYVNPVNFKYKDAEDESIVNYGIIAQELQESLEKSDLPYNSLIKEQNDFCYVNYQELHGLELSGIKDLYNIIEKQQEEINELKSLVNKLIEK